jgi:mono/diheme cytochrome c family protein
MKNITDYLEPEQIQAVFDYVHSAFPGLPHAADPLADWHPR